MPRYGPGQGQIAPNTGAVGAPAAAPAVAAPAAGPAASPTTAAASGLLTSPNWQNQVAGLLAGGAGPTEAQAGLGAALGTAGLAMTPAQEGVSAAELGNNAGYGLASALLGYEGIGLQSQGLASQAATAGKQQGLEEAGFGVQQTAFPEQQAEATLANERAQRGLADQGAISGTLNTEGHGRDVAAQSAQYGWNMADIYRNQRLSELGQQSEEVGFKGQEESIANARAQLGLSAQGQGLSAQQVTDQLKFGLGQLGVSSSPEQYLASIANAQSGEAQALAGVGSAGALIGGLGPMNGLFGGY